ncbi:hypothetical protein [Halobacillus andaensis]|uniref:hypothetical protein n=1 Tax=Halobacillus andaensis TaxID=1176239 RepID=UPI003D752FE7
MKEEPVLVPIPELDFSKDYLADLDKGLIWSVKSNRYLKQKANRFGYRYTSLKVNGKPTPYSIHSLIMSAGMGVKCDWWLNQGLEINHDDKFGDNPDSFYKMSLCTRKQQYEEKYDPSVRAKLGKSKRLREDEVCEILEQFIEFRDTNGFKFSSFVLKMSEAYGKHYNTVYYLLKGKSHKRLTNGLI